MEGGGLVGGGGAGVSEFSSPMNQTKKNTKKNLGWGGGVVQGEGG